LKIRQYLQSQFCACVGGGNVRVKIGYWLLAISCWQLIFIHFCAATRHAGVRVKNGFAFFTRSIRPQCNEGRYVGLDIPFKLLPVILLTVFLTLSLSAVAFAKNAGEKTVKSVEVQLNISGSVYQGLKERIEYSVNRVGEKLLISQPVSLLENNLQSVKQIIYNVFSKVLVGFQTEAVEVILGEHTKLTLSLTPIPPLITKIDLVLNDGIPDLSFITKEAAAKVEAELNRIYIGLPVAALAWADNTLNLVINYLVEREFPGFMPVFTMIPGENARIKVGLSPLAPVVSELTVRYSSTSLPIWLVRSKVKKQQRHLNLLKGLPLEFLIHYQPQIEQYFTEYFNSFPQNGQGGITTKVKIVVGEKTNIDIAISSSYYRTKLEARCFTGEHESFSNLQGYLGYQINNCEIYTSVSSLNNPDGLYKIGFKVPISTNFYGGFEYEMQQYYKTFCLEYRFERGDYLELNLGLEGNLDKALIGFVINSNLNLELVNYDGRYGIQLMFHFW
jgi:hypothetical protein